MPSGSLIPFNEGLGYLVGEESYYNPVSEIALKFRNIDNWPEVAFKKDSDIYADLDTPTEISPLGVTSVGEAEECGISSNSWGFSSLPVMTSPGTIVYEDIEEAYWFSSEILKNIKVDLEDEKMDIKNSEWEAAYGQIFYDANTFDRYCPDRKTDVWEIYNSGDYTNYYNGSGTKIRRSVVARQLNRLGVGKTSALSRRTTNWNRNNHPLNNICFGEMVFRFLKRQMVTAIEVFLADPNHKPTIVEVGGNQVVDINTANSKKPYPELLLYLYEQFSYLTDLKNEATLEYLYTRIPEIFYPYRDAFIVKIGVKNSCAKKYKKISKRRRSTNRDLQATVGLTYNFNSPEGDAYSNPFIQPVYPIDLPDFGRETLVIETFSGTGLRATNVETEYSAAGDIWWKEQLIARLPNRFLTIDQLITWIGPQLLSKLQAHVAQFSETYEDKNNYSVPWTDNIITGEHGYHNTDPLEALNWWETFFEDAMDSFDETHTKAQANAREIEIGDIENLDFSFCQPDIPIAPPASNCGFCIPNPNAIIPDWTTLTSDEPFLNEKTCNYSITMTTPFSNGINASGDNHIPSIMADEIRPGIEKMLSFYNKENSKETVDLVILEAQAEDYFVPTRPNLKIKVLVTLRADIMDRLPLKSDSPSSDEEAAAGESTEVARTPAVVTLKGVDIRPFFHIVTKAMYKMGIESELGIFKGADKRPGLNFLHLNSGLNKYKTKLIQFLRRKTFVINPARKNISALDDVILNFSAQLDLVSIQAKKIGCPYEDITDGLEEFKQTNPINDKTISALISQLPSIVEDITSRQGLDWSTFAAKYMFPATPSIPRDTFEEQTANTANECNIGKVLSNIAKPIITLGEANFDQILNFDQLVAQELGSQICYTIENHQKNDRQLADPGTLLRRQKDQWQRQLNAADSIFKDLPSILDEQVNNLDDFFTVLIDKLGFCGMAALLEAGIDCAGASLGLEISAKAALKGVINNAVDKEMESLFFALNPNLRELIRNSVKELTDIPLPWDTGYRAGSYLGAGVTYGVQYEQKRREALSEIGISEEITGKDYNEKQELVYPEDCPGLFTIPGDPYQYSWQDEQTLVWIKDGKTEVMDLSTISPSHEVFKCRPSMVTIKIPVTSGDST